MMLPFLEISREILQDGNKIQFDDEPLLVVGCLWFAANPNVGLVLSRI